MGCLYILFGVDLIFWFFQLICYQMMILIITYEIKAKRILIVGVNPGNLPITTTKSLTIAWIKILYRILYSISVSKALKMVLQCCPVSTSSIKLKKFLLTFFILRRNHPVLLKAFPKK